MPFTIPGTGFHFTAQGNLNAIRQILCSGNPLMHMTRNLIAGVYHVIKKGNNPDVDAASTPETIWSGSREYSFASAPETLYVSSGDPTFNGEVTVEGLSGAWGRQTASAFANGTGAVKFASTSWIRSNEAWNNSGTPITASIYIGATATLMSNGVPTPINQIRAIVPINHDETLMAIHSIPSGHLGGIVRWYASVGRGQGGPVDKEANAALQIREFGKVFRTMDIRGIDNRGGGGVQHPYELPLRVESKSDVQVTVTDALTNNTEVSAGFDLIVFDETID